jgi:hypothetical protein
MLSTRSIEGTVREQVYAEPRFLLLIKFANSCNWEHLFVLLTPHISIFSN